MCTVVHVEVRGQLAMSWGVEPGPQAQLQVPFVCQVLSLALNLSL